MFVWCSGSTCLKSDEGLIKKQASKIMLDYIYTKYFKMMEVSMNSILIVISLLKLSTGENL
jgi:hypothetical protein